LQWCAVALENQGQIDSGLYFYDSDIELVIARFKPVTDTNGNVTIT